MTRAPWIVSLAFTLALSGAATAQAPPPRVAIPSVPARPEDVATIVDATDADFVAHGFYETEIHRVTRHVGDIAHVFSTYEMRRTPGGPLLGRGVNSLELYWDGARWWIAAAVWIDEAPGHPIPPDLLP